MNYTTKNLKSDSYESFFAECEKAGLTIDGEIITSSHNHSLDLVGTLYKATGVILTDSDCNEYPEKLAEEGFHANLKYKISVGLEALEINVISPDVIFSGD